ncbi:hypothetical protein GCM10023176_10760 [Micromonospora coerulea]|uniref:Tyr recombinase domain-containing protein n=1 Tax=Micromonospora coerulea TaxID=47856 RepID=A0ABP8S8Q0_9ACTN
MALTGRRIQFVHAVLRNGLQHAMREELLSRNVAKLVRVPSPRYKVGKGLSVDHVRKILAAAAGHRLHALYVVAATMGLRRGELVGLRWSDVDLDEGTLRVQQTVQRVAGQLHVLDAKTEDSEAVLPLPEVTWLTLLEHQERQQASEPPSPRCGRTMASSSPRSGAPRRSPPISAAPSPGSGRLGSACTICGTPWFPC